MYTLLTTTLLLGYYARQTKAESHTVRFQNNCGKGTPQLVQAGAVLSTGQDYTSNGELQSAIAYLQTGDCSTDGNNCALVEVNLANPQSFSDLSLIPSHALNVETAFSYYGGDGSCDGLGASCADPNCDTAYHVPTDDQVVRACNSADINVLVTFCGGGGSTFTSASPNSQSSQQSGGANASESSGASSTGAGTGTNTETGTATGTNTETGAGTGATGATTTDTSTNTNTNTNTATATNTATSTNTGNPTTNLRLKRVPSPFPGGFNINANAHAQTQTQNNPTGSVSHGCDCDEESDEGDDDSTISTEFVTGPGGTVQHSSGQWKRAIGYFF